MRACGVSLYRATAPLLMLGLLAGGFLLLVQERALARGKIQADRIDAEMRKLPPRGLNVSTRQWLGGRGGQIYHYSSFNPRTREIAQLTIFEVDPVSWRLVKQTFAPAVRHRNGAWQASAGWVQTFPEDGIPVRRPLPAGVLEGIEPPDYFGTETVQTGTMNMKQLRTYVADLQSSGADARGALVQLHQKIAFPAVTIVMTLIAIPFAVTTGRRGALYGIGLGIALSIAYWFILTIFGALGSAGMLPPALAAWAPNIFFAAGALYLLLTVRT
jgi:LPS export ABC transporter permease LptG